MLIKEAIILAGGLGTRLRSVIPDRPKCMAPIAGKPFLYYVIRYFQEQGIQRFILSLGYKHEIIEQYIESEFALSDFKFSIEAEPLGTGGAVKFACAEIRGETVLVLNGDTFFEVGLDQMAFFHHTHEADCTLSLKPMKHFDRYGVVALNQDYSIESFQEKQYHKEGLINGGVYALDTGKFLSENLPEKFSFEKDYLERYYLQRRMFGVVQDNYFIDIGIPDDYEKAQRDLVGKFAN